MKRRTASSRTAIKLAAAVAALAAARAAPAQTAGYDITILGLSGSEFLRNDGYLSSTTSDLNSIGQMAGVALRFKQTVIDFGQSAWFFNPLTGQTVPIGLGGKEHTTFDGYEFSQVLDLNDGGFVIGTSDRYNRTVVYRGQSLWSYNAATNATTKMGLSDAAHTGTDGYQFSSFQQTNLAGQVLGSSSQFDLTGASTGASLWFYNPANLTTTPLGFTDAIHTRDDGYQHSVGTLITTGGSVVGLSDRYIGTGTYMGQSAWYCTPAAGMMTIGLTGTEFASPAGNQFNGVVSYDGAGDVLGSTTQYNGGTASTGQAAWYLNAASLTTTRIGLLDAEHTGAGNAQASYGEILTASGNVIGSSTRYNSGSAVLGQSAWFYMASTGTTSKIGLFASPEFTDANGNRFSRAITANTANQVIGISTRYDDTDPLSGQSAWFYDPATNTTSQMGLVDTEHTEPVTNLRYSDPDLLSDTGLVVGRSERYGLVDFGNSTFSDVYLGQTNWLYNSATNSTIKIGLTDAEHTDFWGYQYSVVHSLTNAGQVVGYADRYGQTPAYLGQSVWYYNPLTLSTSKIGLFDSEHTSGLGSKYSSTDIGSGFQSINASGQVVGYSTRYSNVGNATLGQSVWFYNPATAATTKMGLTDTEHTRQDNFKTSQVFHFDDAGRVYGYSERYNQGTIDLGQSAWAFSPATLATTKIGLADTMHTRSDGYRYTVIEQINTAGQAYGYSTRYNQTANNLGQSAWFYDPGINTTASLVFSAATDGRANTAVNSFGNDGAILGDYEKFTGNSSLGYFGFYWSAGTGLLDLGDSVAGGGLNALGATRISDPLGAGTDGSIYGATATLTSGGSAPWRLTPATITWTGDGGPPDGTWNSAVDWNLTAVPGAQNSVIFSLPSSYDVMFTASAPARSANIVAGDVTWQLAGKTITLTDQLRVGDSALTPVASLCINGGNVVASGGVTVNSHASLRNYGTIQGNLANAGSLIVSAGKSGRNIGSLSNSGSIIVANAGVLRVTGSLTNTGTIDLAGGDLILDYSSVSPLATVRSQIITGYNGGGWNGAGIRSSLAAGSSPRTALGYAEASSVLGAAGGTFHGQTVDGTTVLVKYTYAGDANLDGMVDQRDLTALANGWHTAGSWISGDFNYNGIVDAADLGILAANWQVGVSSQLAPGSLSAALTQMGISDASVPEPAGIAVGIALATIAGARRRRRASISE